MEIRRTANAGILLTLDDVQILLDGVCRQFFPYLPTPSAEVKKLSEPFPDVVAYTHIHEDHFDADYARRYCEQTGRPILSTAQAARLIPDGVWTDAVYTAGRVKLTAVPTRHMGRWGLITDHRSFVVEGSRTVWFLGDASPNQMKQFSGLPKPDVLVVPYPYLSTPMALKVLENYLPCKIVLLHLPSREEDPEGIWAAIVPGMEQLKQYLHVPMLSETIHL